MLNNRMIKETAHVWGISKKELKSVNEWVSENVAPHNQWKAFTTMLRRLKDSNK